MIKIFSHNSDRKVCNNLFRAIKAADENNNQVVLEEGELFPVSAKDVRGNTLFIRTAYRDLFELFSIKVLSGKYPGMLVIGPTGVGKV